MTHEEHQSACCLFNIATSRNVGGNDDAPVEQYTEFGLILIGAGIPTSVNAINKYGGDDYRDVPHLLKNRLKVARWLRELADRIEGKGLAKDDPATVAARSELGF